MKFEQLIEYDIKQLNEKSLPLDTINAAIKDIGEMDSKKDQKRHGKAIMMGLELLASIQNDKGIQTLIKDMKKINDNPDSIPWGDRALIYTKMMVSAEKRLGDAFGDFKKAFK